MEANKIFIFLTIFSFIYRADFKRDNKNRPREMSSKVKVGRLRDVVGFKSGEAKKALDKRDPRFDALCGDYDEKVKQNVVFSCQMQKKL